VDGQGSREGIVLDGATPAVGYAKVPGTDEGKASRPCFNADSFRWDSCTDTEYST
jgi:hypothetical protein